MNEYHFHMHNRAETYTRNQNQRFKHTIHYNQKILPCVVGFF